MTSWEVELLIIGIVVLLGLGGLLLITMREEEGMRRPGSFRGEIYKDKANEWRWRVLARNNQIVATCHEGYKNFAHARRMVRRVCRVRKVKVLSR